MGVGEDDIHAEAARQPDDALGHGEGLAVRGRVCPAHRDLLALELVEAPEMVGEMEEVGHGLGGMVYIGLKVHDAGAVGQDARGHAVVESLAYLALILVALSAIRTTISMLESARPEARSICWPCEPYIIRLQGSGNCCA